MRVICQAAFISNSRSPITARYWRWASSTVNLASSRTEELVDNVTAIWSAIEEVRFDVQSMESTASGIAGRSDELGALVVSLGACNDPADDHPEATAA